MQRFSLEILNHGHRFGSWNGVPTISSLEWIGYDTGKRFGTGKAQNFPFPMGQISDSHLYPVFPFSCLGAVGRIRASPFAFLALGSLLNALHPQLAVWACEEKVILGYGLAWVIIKPGLFRRKLCCRATCSTPRFARSPSLHVKLFVQPIGPSNYDLPYTVHHVRLQSVH
jgi:hypothetical protein